MNKLCKEIWKPIIGYEDSYEVSNTGIVRSINRITFNRKLKGVVLLPRNTGIGYKQVTLFKDGKRKYILVHHLVFDHFSDHKRNGRKLQVDHIDNDKSNNHIDNLQLVTNRENSSKDRVGYTSKYIGVYYNKQRQKWAATIYHNKKNNFLGYFDNEEDAAKSYQTKLKSIQNEKDL